MMRSTAAVLAALALTGTLAGCGGGKDKPAAATQAASSSAPAATPAVSKKQVDARAVFNALKAAGLPIKLSVQYDETNDPNKLLGRPGQYTSKLAWTDSRVNADDASGGEGDTSYGGGVEVFGSDTDAKARFDYVSAFTKNMPMVSEYNWAIGRIFLRVSHVLTPKQAEEYRAAVEKL